MFEWKSWKILVLALLLVFLLVLMGTVLPTAIDWHTAFRPAAWELLSGRSPYNIEGYFNAPWALLPLIPMALLPEHIGRSVLVLVSLIAYAYTAKQLGAKIYTIALLLLSPPVFHGLLHGNIDWLATLGFVLPPQIGLLFVVAKPQIGIAVVVYWLFDSWKTGGIKKTVQVFWPLTVLSLLSFLLFGFWPLRFEKELVLWWNASLWPALIPVGLGLLVAAIRKREIKYAFGASPCLSPYVLLHSWVGALLAIVGAFPEFLAAFVGLWVLVIIRYLG
jgi:hypothetical protein